MFKKKHNHERQSRESANKHEHIMLAGIVRHAMNRAAVKCVQLQQLYAYKDLDAAKEYKLWALNTRKPELLSNRYSISEVKEICNKIPYTAKSLIQVKWIINIKSPIVFDKLVQYKMSIISMHLSVR